MANDDNGEDFGKELAAAFDAEETPQETKPADPPKADDATPPATLPATDTPPKPAEEPKKDDKPAAPEVPKEGADATPPADPSKTPEDPATPPKTPETPPAEEQPKPLTLADVEGVISKVRTEERTSGQALQQATTEVIESYYPDGLSNTLVDQQSGKELKTPQDVVDASGGTMGIEEAAQWLTNEQFKLDSNIAAIKKDAEKIAETTLTFKNNAITALQKYEPLFKAYPTLQKKVYDKMMKLVKADEAKGVILSAPDPLDFYDDYLEPYQQAYEFSTQQPATNPTPPAAGTPGAPATPPPATPGQADRMDEGADGGANTEVDDPNDFAQQVGKELAKGL